MPDMDKAWDVLRREYGIRNEQELQEAMEDMEKINIGIFVSQPIYPDMKDEQHNG